MREISDLFESLYSHFILRDVLAKVLPGVIDLVAIAALFAPKSLRLLQYRFFEPGFFEVVAVYGISFMLGMLFQYLGSLTPFIHIHAWREESRQKTVVTSLSKAVEFQKTASKDQSLLRQRERFAVLKEMAANYAVSLTLILLAVLRVGVFTSNRFQPHALAVSILFLLIIVSLIGQNRFHASEQRNWEEQVIMQFSKEASHKENVNQSRT